MTHYYYTVASKEYTYKILLLYNSMMKYDKYFKFYIVCLHKEGKEMLEKFGLENAVLIEIGQLEAYDGELAEVKEKRSIKQYAWAAKPIAALYILDNYKDVDHIIWLDGDTVFMSSPDPIYEEWGDHPVVLTEEKFTGKYAQVADTYGFYNTGFMGYRRSETAVKCLKYFREKLLEWNYDEKEQYRWNDQLYVSDWPQRFENIGIIKNPGVNMTPFIFNRLLDEDKCVLSVRDGCQWMGNVKITLFHFYGFTYFNRHEFELCYYTDIHDQLEKNEIYLPYIKDCIKIMDRISKIDKSYYSEKPLTEYGIRNYYYIDTPEESKEHAGKIPRRKKRKRNVARMNNRMRHFNEGE